MRCEGHLRQSQFMKGAWQDEYIYALLLDEWLSQQSVGTKGPDASKTYRSSLALVEGQNAV